MAQGGEASDSIYNAEDFIKPLKYLFELKNEKPEQVLARYDKDKSYLLSGTELAAMVKWYTKLTLTNYEISLLANFLRKTFGRTEIKRPEFTQLISLKFERVYEQKKAKGVVQFLQQYLHLKHGPKPGKPDNVLREEHVKQVFRPYEDPDIPHAYLVASFKRALHSFKLQPTKENPVRNPDKALIDNFTAYLEKQENGTIELKDLIYVLLKNFDSYDPVKQVQKIVE